MLDAGWDQSWYCSSVAKSLLILIYFVLLSRNDRQHTRKMEIR